MVRRRGFGVFALVLGLCAAVAPAPASAQRLDRVSIDRVRVRGGGNVEVWTSAQDPDGQSIAGLDRSSFTVAWDGRTPDQFKVERVLDRDPELHLTMLVDGELARDESSALRSLLLGVADRAGGHDRLRIAVTNRDDHADGAHDHGDDLADRFGSLAQGGAAGHLYDALFREVRSLSRLGRGTAGAVLLVTHGIESGSGHGLPEILALSRGNDQHVPVLVLLLDPRGGASEGERLSRFAPASGGSFDRLDSADRLASAGARAVRRLRGAYVLAFHDPRWDGSAERHSLELTVNAGPDRRSATANVLTAEVLARAWWQGALPWVLLVMVILLGLGTLPFLLRRPLVRLRVVEGGEKGFVYEIYEVPVTIGAAAGNDLIFEDEEVSRNHAVFERRGATIELVDSNSENGTFVNGDRVGRRRVSRGDRVRLGEAVEFEVLR